VFYIVFFTDAISFAEWVLSGGQAHQKPIYTYDPVPCFIIGT